MEEYHWTPRQISEIPYKTIQKLFLVRNQKSEAEAIQAHMRRMEADSKSRAKGGNKFTREV